MNQQHQNNQKVKNESHPIKNQNHMDNNGHKITSLIQAFQKKVIINP